MKGILAERLYLSGMDARAADLARRLGLGLELTAFTYAPELDRPAARDEAKVQCAGVARLWLHGPFAELCPAAIDPLVRDVARARYRQAFEAAAELGVSRVVLHAGFTPYVYFPEWFVGRSVEFWCALLPELPEGMSVALENVMEPGPEMLVDIAKQVDDPRLGLCLDVGHANTCVSKTPPADWVAPMAPWLRHVHLHSNTGNLDDHAPVGTGTVPAREIIGDVLRRCPAATFTLENMDCLPALETLRQWGYLEGEL